MKMGKWGRGFGIGLWIILWAGSFSAMAGVTEEGPIRKNLVKPGSMAAETMTAEPLEDSREDSLWEGDIAGPDSEEEAEVQRIIEEYLDAMENVPGEAAEAELVQPSLEMSVRGQGLEYRLPDGSVFFSSVPNGMITGEPVEFRPPDNALSLIQVDDELAAMQSRERFTEPGSYRIRMLCYSPLKGREINYTVYEVLFYFTILEPVTRQVGVVQAPEGFVITGVRKDGSRQEPDSGWCVFLQEDGVYEIDYEKEEGQPLKLKTRLARDTTAPFLNFSQEVGRDAVPSPLSFQPSEPDCTIRMLYNGSSGYAVSNTLTTAGIYELRVSDRAGNSRSYQVRIRQTYELMDYRLMLMGVVLFGGIVLWMFFLRRHMRVL